MKNIMHLKSFILLSITFLFFSSFAQAKVLDIQQWETKKGTPVYFVHTEQVPVLIVQVAFDAGSARDGKLPGTAMLVNSLMNEGNAGLRATQLAEGFENVGAEYNHWLDRDMSVFQLHTMTEPTKLNTAVNYFTKIFQPDFPPVAFEREKQQQQIAIERINESPNAVAQKAFLKAIYPHHPYGNPLLGTEKSASSIELLDIKTFHQQYYTNKNAIITMSGNIDINKAKEIAEQITQPLSEGARVTPLPKAIADDKSIDRNIAYPSAQTIIEIGQVGISHHDPDYFSLLVGNYTLGGGMLVSRLSQEIRDKRGLTYGITSGFSPMVANGPFVIAFATRTEKAAESLDITQKTLIKFLSEGPNPSELMMAKRFVKGNFPLRFETNADIARVLLTIGFNQLPLDYLDTYLSHINTVTAKQVKVAFNKHVHPETMVTIIVGKKS